MKNAEWCIKNNIRLKDLCLGPTYYGPQEDQIGYYSSIAFHELYRGKRLGKSAAESILTWLDMEHDERVLEVVHAHWIKEKKEHQVFMREIYKCSNCGNYLDFHGVNAGRGDANYCPNCGADMRGEQDG